MCRPLCLRRRGLHTLLLGGWGIPRVCLKARFAPDQKQTYPPYWASHAHKEALAKQSAPTTSVQVTARWFPRGRPNYVSPMKAKSDITAPGQTTANDHQSNKKLLSTPPTRPFRAPAVLEVSGSIKAMVPSSSQ